MAVPKATHSNPPAQLRPNHQFKAEIFEILRHLNRGYGVALAALDKLESKDRSQNQRRSSNKVRTQGRDDLRVFSAVCLREFRNRTETLQAEANRDLLRLIAAHEDRQAERFGRPDKP
jgi:hypothetical protein